MSVPDISETRPIFLVTGCQRYRTYVEAAIQRFADPAFRIIGYVGDPTGTLTEPVYDTSSQIVVLPTPDNYETLPTKVHAAFCWAAATFPNSPGIWKTDDDIIYYNKEQLRAVIFELVNEPYWGLQNGACRENHVNPARVYYRFEDTTLRPRHQQAIYCYGHGYWVSRSTLPIVIAAGADFRTSFLEDVCMGYVLNRARILPKRGIVIPYTELQRGPELLRAK